MKPDYTKPKHYDPIAIVKMALLPQRVERPVWDKKQTINFLPRLVQGLVLSRDLTMQGVSHPKDSSIFPRVGIGVNLVNFSEFRLTFLRH